MSIASVVDRNQAAETHAGRSSQEVDDDSGNEDFGYYGDDNDGGMDVDEPEQDPTPEPPPSKANDKARRNRVETPDDDDIPAPDDDDQFDVGVGYDDEPQQEEEEEPEPEESPRSKRARLAQEKTEKGKEKAKQKREPLRQKDPNAQPEKTRRNFEPQSDDDDDTGLRRGKRQRYAPLQWWRGEHAVVRRPRPDEPPVLISEIVRIPEAQPEPLSKKHRRRGTTKPPSCRNERNNSKQAEVWVESPDEGWDTETEQNAMVIDYDTKQEMENDMVCEIHGLACVKTHTCVPAPAVIAQTAAMLHPKQPLNVTYAFGTSSKR
ncbi:hypothetical protein FRC05_007309 [Tulasnella sp. 425]|nr:hypothetical protein FRC05_007309 [Tulasnella sp. 425]